MNKKTYIQPQTFTESLLSSNLICQSMGVYNSNIDDSDQMSKSRMSGDDLQDIADCEEEEYDNLW